MKKITLLLYMIFIVIPIFSQYDYLKYENGQILFKKVYSMDSLNSEQIENLLKTTSFVGVKLENFKSDVILGKLSGSPIPYKEYGGKWENIPILMSQEFYGDITIIWKDSKYKVTISNIYFLIHTATNNLVPEVIRMECVEFLVKKGELNQRKSIVNSGVIIEKYLSELFVFNNKKEW